MISIRLFENIIYVLDLLCSKLATVHEEVGPVYTKSASTMPVQGKQVINQNFQQNQYPGTWYIPPIEFNQQQIYNPPPPPPPPPLRNEDLLISSKVGKHLFFFYLISQIL